MKTKRVLTLPVYEKTTELDTMFKSLRANSTLEKFDLLLVVSDQAKPEVLDCVSKNILNLPLPVRIWHNAAQLGVDLNPYRVYELAFIEFDADFICGLEDDLLLSPDVLALALWFEQFVERDSFFSYCSVNYHSRADAPTNVVGTTQDFDIKAACFSSEIWHKYIYNRYNDTREGFDIWLNRKARALNMLHLTPALSRCRHNANWGSHSTPEYQAKMFTNMPINTTNSVTSYQYDPNYK